MNELENVIKDINKKFKTSLVNEGVVFNPVPRIPFSSPRLNYMTYGGLPAGRIVEFAGAEGGGKTTTALDIVSNVQRMQPDKKVVYIDVERTLDAEWAQKIGVDVDKLILVSPDEQTAEEIFEMAKKLVETGEVSVCVIDSLAALVSAQAYSKDMTEKTYGGISMSLTLFSREMIPVCARTNCLLIGINQLRADMNSSYGGTQTTGGRAWRHNCSLRMLFTKGDFIDAKWGTLNRSCENPAGNLVKVALAKSKVCKSDRKVGFYTLNYLTGIDYIADLIDVAIKEGFIAAAGAWFRIIDPTTGEIMCIDNKELKFQGRANLHSYLESNSEVLNTLSDQVLQNSF